MNIKQPKIYKYAIIGGGTAGLFLANKLKKDKNLIVIESGPKKTYEKNHNNFKYKMKKNDFYKLHTDQIAGIGGNTNIWGGQLLPFTKNDINKEKGWPFELEKIESDFEEVSKELFGQKINFYSKPFIEKITNLPLIELEDQYLRTHISARLREPNFKKLYFNKIKLDIDFLYKSFVNKIDKKEGLFFIHCKNEKNVYKIIKSENVIITCGAIQSVRLLINSCNECNLFSNDNLGNGFIDHTTVIFQKLNVINRFSFLRMFNTKYLNNGHKIGVRISASEKYIKKSKQNISGMIMVDQPKSFVKKILNLITIFLTKDLFKFIYKPFGEIILCFIVEQITSNDKNLKISKEGTQYLNWNIHKNEVNTIQDFGRKVLNNLTQRKLIMQPVRLKESDVILSKMHSTNHPMGGAIMHYDQKKSVVNNNLEVIGCRDLYICSTAVFPSGSHSNPTMTLLALANRLAKHLTRKRS